MNNIKKNKVSQIADGLVAIKARHVLYYQGELFNDTVAWSLMSTKWQRILSNSFIEFILIRILKSSTLPLQTHILVRSRYTEDILLSCLENKEKIQQYILLGAGFDSFAWRYSHLSSKLSIFELDRKELIDEKLKRLRNNRMPIPFNLSLLDINFEQHDIYDVLQAGKVNFRKPIFCSWIGVSFYLEESNVYKVLEQFMEYASSGSHLVFDYLVAEKNLVTAKDISLHKAFKRMVKYRNEPILSEFSPDEIKKRISKMGFKIMEVLSPDQQVKKYVANLQNPLPTCNLFYSLWLKKE